MSDTKREELIEFIVGAIEIIEGEQVSPDEFSDMPDDELQREADFYDYLLDK